MGGHARLAGRLREGIERSVNVMERESKEEKQRTSADDVWTLREKKKNYEKQVLPHRFVRQTTMVCKRSGSHHFPLDTCIQCKVLLLGKMGHGTSTLGNRMLNSDGWFKINDQRCPQTAQGSSMISSASQLKDYNIEVYDHTGLFEGASSVVKHSSAVPEEVNLVSSAIPECLSLVTFVLKRGCDFDENEVAIIRSVVSEWQISRISALVLTHCERLSEEERGEMIEQFKKDHPSIAELMGKGILAVGFPDSSHIQPGSLLSQRVEEDKANLRQLIYSCDEPVFNPWFKHQNENRRRLCCSIL
jgi:hypothetical protein